MTNSICSITRRLTHLSVPLWLTVFSITASEAYGQKSDVETVPTANYSYKIDPDLKKQPIELDALSESLAGIDFNYEDAYGLRATNDDELEALRNDPLIEALKGAVNEPALNALGQSLEQGGMSTAAAIVVLSVASIGAEKCTELGKVIYKAPILGRSSMFGVQYAIDENTQMGLGRGQFDIQTTKFVLCRDIMTNEIDGVPINVRWVFNVNGQSLTMKSGNLDGPNMKPYKQNFHAEGIGIQVVLMEIDGVVLPTGNPVYHTVENACIDIWLPKEVKGSDIYFPTSIPQKGLFCAGGYCKTVPPGLDATQ